jgi:uncharacterized protein YecE (DUF72 family)
VLQEKLRLEKNAKVPLTKETREEMVKAFGPSLEVLRRAKKLGVLLLQLSPAFSPRKHDLTELEDVLELVRDYHVAIELRNRNWAEGEQLQKTLDFMRKQCAIFVNIDAPAEKHFTIMPSDLDAITNNAGAYLRLHGRDPHAYITGKTVAERFNYDYSEAEIEEIADRSERLAAQAKEVHVIFNNNARDYAPHAAVRLRKALGQLVSPPPQTAELF